MPIKGLYGTLIPINVYPNGPVTVAPRISVSIDARDIHGRSHLLGAGRGRPAGLRGLCRPPEASLTMIMILLYAAGGAAVAIYMIAALLRPEKF